MMKTPGGALRAVFASAAERADVNPLRPAMDGMGPRITRLFEDFLGLDDLMDLGLRWMGLGVHHIDARRADARNDQIAALEEGVAGERRQGRRAGVPAEMMKFVALVGHRHRMNDLAVSRRAALHVDDCERVGLRRIAAEQCGIGELLLRPFHRELRRRVKGRIRSHGHGVSFPVCVEAQLDCALRALAPPTALATDYNLTGINARGSAAPEASHAQGIWAKRPSARGRHSSERRRDRLRRRLRLRLIFLSPAPG